MQRDFQRAVGNQIKWIGHVLRVGGNSLPKTDREKTDPRKSQMLDWIIVRRRQEERLAYNELKKRKKVALSWSLSLGPGFVVCGLVNVTGCHQQKLPQQKKKQITYNQTALLRPTICVLNLL